MIYNIVYYPDEYGTSHEHNKRSERCGGTTYTLEIKDGKIKLKSFYNRYTFDFEEVEYYIKHKSKGHHNLLTSLYWLQSVRKHGYKKLNLLNLIERYKFKKSQDFK